MDFIMALPRTQRRKDSIMVVIDRFSKMAHFVACTRTEDAAGIVDIYIKEIAKLHRVLKTMVSLRDYDLKLTAAEFVFNRAPSSSTSQSPFEIEKANAGYKAGKGPKKARELQRGDMISLHLRKKMFPGMRKNKLMPGAEGSFGPNAYKLNLPGEYGVCGNFNIGDNQPYYEECDEEKHSEDLRSNPNQEGEVGVGAQQDNLSPNPVTTTSRSMARIGN
ncbi:uncharacterized protein LOC141628478 [Silene latifolia]|uniref:uncharacterized protein LOC141628478 n=1 Tax=Silene latifolia TaxID=37657 RepID=UPI003D770611